VEKVWGGGRWLWREVEYIGERRTSKVRSKMGRVVRGWREENSSTSRVGTEARRLWQGKVYTRQEWID